MIKASEFSIAIDGRVVLSDITFEANGSRPVVIVGESGAGKSTLAKALVGMSPGARSGSLYVGDFDLARADRQQLCDWRGRGGSMLPQNVHDSLNPQSTLLDQVAESLKLHCSMGSQSAIKFARGLLTSVGIAEDLHARYPSQCSGGQRQLALLAIALAPAPQLLVLDEPTSALDPVSRDMVLRRLRAEATQRQVVVVTRDLSLATSLSGQIVVLYAGMVVEVGTAEQTLKQPQHPYTRALIRAWPRIGGRDLQGIPGSFQRLKEGCPFADRCAQRVESCATERPRIHQGNVACHRGGIVSVLTVKGLHKRIGGKNILANLLLDVKAGETIVIVGESGAGKTTLARILVGLQTSSPDGVPTQEGRGVNTETVVGYVPQNAAGSFASHFNVLDAVAEPLTIRFRSPFAEHRQSVRDVLKDVALPYDEEYLHRQVRSLSGGEVQRLAIARALILRPALLIADEPTAALDASAEAKTLRLLLDVQERRGLALLIVTHDLSVARRIADRTLQLHEGILREFHHLPVSEGSFLQ